MVFRFVSVLLLNTFFLDSVFNAESKNDFNFCRTPKLTKLQSFEFSKTLGPPSYKKKGKKVYFVNILSARLISALESLISALISLISVNEVVPGGLA